MFVLLTFFFYFPLKIEQICSANIKTKDYNYCFQQFKDGTCSISCKSHFHSDGFDCTRSPGSSNTCKEACLRQYFNGGLCKRGSSCQSPPQCKKKSCNTNPKFYSDAIVVEFIKKPSAEIFATKTVPERLSKALLSLVVLDQNRQDAYHEDTRYFYKVQKGSSKFGKQESFEEIATYFALLASRGQLYNSIRSIRSKLLIFIIIFIILTNW